MCLFNCTPHTDSIQLHIVNVRMQVSFRFGIYLFWVFQSTLYLIECNYCCYYYNFENIFLFVIFVDQTSFTHYPQINVNHAYRSMFWCWTKTWSYYTLTTQYAVASGDPTPVGSIFFFYFTSWQMNKSLSVSSS